MEGKGTEDLLRRNYRELDRKRGAALSQATDLDLRRFLAQATAALGALCTIVLAGAWLWAAQLPAPVVAETPPAVAAPDPCDGRIAALEAALSGLTEEHRFAQARVKAAEEELAKVAGELGKAHTALQAETDRADATMALAGEVDGRAAAAEAARDAALGEAAEARDAAAQAGREALAFERSWRALSQWTRVAWRHLSVRQKRRIQDELDKAR